MIKFRLPNGLSVRVDLFGAALLALAVIAYFQQRQLDAILWAVLYTGTQIAAGSTAA